MSIYLAVFLWACATVAVVLLAGLVQHITRKPQPQPESAPKLDPKTCDNCRTYKARTLATTKDGEDRQVCFGCLDAGFVKGLWRTARKVAS